MFSFDYNTKNKIGFIDWNGEFHECDYGEHSVLAFKLIQKARAEVLSEEEEKVLREEYDREFRVPMYGNNEVTEKIKLIRLEENDRGACYCTIPRGSTDKSIETLKQYKSNTEFMEKAIKEALEEFLEDGIGSGSAYPGV